MLLAAMVLEKVKEKRKEKKKRGVFFFFSSCSPFLLVSQSLISTECPSEPTAWPASSGSCPRSPLLESLSGPSGTESAS